MFRSQLIDRIGGVNHAFGGADPEIPEGFEALWETRARKKQVHSNLIAEFALPGQECGEVDGVFTQMREVVASVVTADCIPVLAARADAGAVAAIHAGWRGLESGILATFRTLLSQDQENPEDWVIALGPSIGPCCYEVSEELIATFAKQLHATDPTIPQIHWNPTHRKIDLRAIAQIQLRSLGFTQIENVGPCTFCTPALHSYRREGKGMRQHSAIVLL